MSAKRTRWKGPRTCCVCGRVWSASDRGWDVHVAIVAACPGAPSSTQELDTCSPACRRTKGLPEREPGLVTRA